MSSDPNRRIQRILALIPYLRKNPGTPIETLARLSGAPATEILADLNRILLCGVPPYLPDDYIGVYLEDGRVSLRFADHFRRPIRFTLKEALALKLALESLPAGGDPAYREARRTLLAKIDGVLGREATRDPAADAAPGASGATARAAAGERIAGRLETSRGREAAQTTRGRARRERVLAAIARSIEVRRVLEVEYYSASSDALRARKIHPYGVVDQDGETYVVAYDTLRDALIPFRVDRIREARVIEGERFSVPTRFSLDDYRKRQMKFPKRPVHDVTIRFSRDVARWVREDREYRGERIDETPEGDLIVTHRAGNLAYLLNRVLQYGKNAEILAPADVRAEMRRHLDAALVALGPK